MGSNNFFKKRETKELKCTNGATLNCGCRLLSIKFFHMSFGDNILVQEMSVNNLFCFEIKHSLSLFCTCFLEPERIKIHFTVWVQTGTGHFSPIGGYHAGRDMVLILDVARFKYPPHWVPLTLLWEAMDTIDKATGQRRG